MFKIKLNNLLCSSILSLLCCGFVKSTCVIKYPDNIETAPIYTKYFGRYKLELPYTKSYIILENNEKIYGKCQTMFNSIVKERKDLYYNSYKSINVKNQKDITLHCLENTLRYENDILQDNVLECQKLDWNIYENNNTQEWCKTNTELAALLLATKSNLAYHVLAEICFDLNNWSLQTIKYSATATTDSVEMLRDVGKTNLETAAVLGEKLWNLKITNDFNTMELDLQAHIKKMHQHNSWLHLANYELSPIVQGKLYENYFKEYSNILNTIWWPNLRLGNWKRFMDMLENYAYNNSFQLYAGTSGIVRIPTDNVEDITTDLTIKFGFKNKPIPAYIWTYLISIDKLNKDFVIVGYNSPYAEFFSRNEIVFCTDICNEIPWLNEISKSFNFNTAGIMFCCSPESIKQTNMLNGFPIELLISRMSTISKQENKTAIRESTSRFFRTTTVPYNKGSSTELIHESVQQISGDHEKYNEVRSTEFIHYDGEEINEDDDDHIAEY